MRWLSKALRFDARSKPIKKICPRVSRLTFPLDLTYCRALYLVSLSFKQSFKNDQIQFVDDLVSENKSMLSILVKSQPDA